MPDAALLGTQAHPRRHFTRAVCGARCAAQRDQTGSLPIEITENGASYNAVPDAGGRVRDAERIAYLRGHLQAAARAIRDGVPIRAYHCRSLLDNFEWAHGYSQRFGILYVDFADRQRRIIKDSGYWYAGVAAAKRVL